MDALDISRGIGSSVGISVVDAQPFAAAGRAALDTRITRQAEIIACIGDHKLPMMATVAMPTLLVVFRKAARQGGDHAAIEL
jgi:hypothetical protein